VVSAGIPAGALVPNPCPVTITVGVALPPVKLTPVMTGAVVEGDVVDEVGPTLGSINSGLLVGLEPAPVPSGPPAFWLVVPALLLADDGTVALPRHWRKAKAPRR